jgi:putative heme-binding domain-containing protein
MIARSFVKLFSLLAMVLVAGAATNQEKSVKAPAGWQVTLFAAPPNVGYPTCLSTSPNGDLYVGIDENGSIDAKPGRGRVVRCTDSDGDGKADKFVTFATMDSPRGIWFENNVLYVQHPPLVEAFIDEDGDGKADRSEVLVRGLGFDLKFRGADHTINGMRMGIDGFLYIACGDYGATNAVGKDGTRIQLRGGGVVRVRPDGSGLEIVSHGQRNIYDVAVSPELDLFTRDNTNDGDGWDVRLSHVVMGGNYGYPTLFKKFGEEIIQPLADYGGGSPCGALFMDEPGFPEGFGRGLYTVEWGRGGVFRHPLTPQGATFNAAQERFIELQRPTDFDVDGSGRLYLSSWQGATFTYNGSDAGFVVRITPPGWSLNEFPDLKKASDEELARRIESASAFARLYAQREILRRGAKPNVPERLERVALSTSPLGSRVAALFTLRQLRGPKAIAAMQRFSQHSELREFALRALADDLGDAKSIPTDLFKSALADANPRVRLQAVTALARLGAVEAAPAVLPLLIDPDPIVSHVAVHALVQLRAIDPCLGVFDSPGSAELLAGAGRVLQSLHEPVVVDGLIGRLAKGPDARIRETITKTLARLANREADWDGRWWGTRPDTTGPYFKPVKWSESAKIEAVLRGELSKADKATLPSLAMTLQNNRVDLPELTSTLLKLAETDAAFRAVAVEMFAGRSTLPDEAIEFMARIAASTNEPAALRAKTIRSLAKAGKPAALDGAVAALTQTGKPPGEIANVWEEFARDNRNGRNTTYFAKLAVSGDENRRLLGYAVLANIASGRFGERNGKALAVKAVEAGWSSADGAVSLLRAINRLRLDGFAFQVRGLLNDPRPDVAEAARVAARTLKLDVPRVTEQATVAKLGFDRVLAIATTEKGDARTGAEVFIKVGCVACHTTRASEAPKGPFLGGIAARYTRAELCESILKPNAKIAQGFETQWFKTKDDEELEGFVTREGGDDLDLRNVAGITTTLAKKNIAERGKREKSIMPEGLADQLTPVELASLLAFLEATRSQ